MIDDTTPSPDSPSDQPGPFESGPQADSIGEQDPNELQDSGPVVDEQFPNHEPTPVHLTSAVYSTFGDEFGDEEAHLLQSRWGDHAVGNEAIARAVVADHPVLDKIYTQFQTDSHGLSGDGADEALRAVYKLSGHKDPRAFLTDYAELINIYRDHADESGSISPAGFYRALHYVGKRLGYTYQRKRS